VNNRFYPVKLEKEPDIGMIINVVRAKLCSNEEYSRPCCNQIITKLDSSYWENRRNCSGENITYPVLNE
jgi:hypothetical protein